MLSKRSEFFRYFLCFLPGLVFPVAGSLSKFVDFPLL